MSFSVAELAKWCGGALRGDAAGRVEGVSTDSRTLRAGDLFVAILGEHFDGHRFVDDASARGAAAVLVSREVETPLPRIVVGDTLEALGALAQAHRARFRGAVVAITGSIGKTTTKEMCAEILTAAGARVHRTPGNLNNQIGLPLSILSLREDADVAVLELGMNHAGELAALARIASPSVGAITQVALAHLGPLGSLEAIARAKGELLDHIRPEGTAVLNADDPRVMSQAHRFPGRRLLFGRAAGADVRAEDVQAGALGTRFRLTTPAGRAEVALQVPGEHLVEDALCAAAAALATGLCGARPAPALAAGLEAFRAAKHRLAVHAAPGGITLIDDSYNANPDSARAALRTLCGARRNGRTIAVLGDMLELGPASEALHGELGGEVARLGVDVLIAVGPLSRHTAREARARGTAEVHEAPDAAAAAVRARQAAKAGDVVLVKGSRGMALERTVEALLEGNP